MTGTVLQPVPERESVSAAVTARAWSGQLRPTVMAGVNYRDADTLKLQVKENEKVLTVTLC